MATGGQVVARTVRKAAVGGHHHQGPGHVGADGAIGALDDGPGPDGEVGGGRGGGGAGLPPGEGPDPDLMDEDLMRE